MNKMMKSIRSLYLLYPLYLVLYLVSRIVSCIVSCIEVELLWNLSYDL